MIPLWRPLTVVSIRLFIAISALLATLPSKSWAFVSSTFSEPQSPINELSMKVFASPNSLSVARRGLTSHVNNEALFTDDQVDAIQDVACVLASVSLCASLTALYWFWRMRQKFRHRLIVLLIFGDMIRSFWLFVFPLVTFTRGKVHSTSKFCQASGFLTLTGIEMVDISILFIAIHTALQVFNPSMTHFGIEEGGLYKYRYVVYVVTSVLPLVLASLAFVKSSTEGYESTGPFCSLPIRPIWYRLAISWIPRYLIMLIVAGLYIAIYIHVAVEFRVIGWLGIGIGSPNRDENTSQTLTVTTDGMHEFDETLPRRLRDSEPSSSSTGQESFATKPPTFETKSSSRKTSGNDVILQLVHGQRPSAPQGSVAHSLNTADDERFLQTLPNDGCVDNLAESRYHHLQQPTRPQVARTEETSRNGKDMDMQRRHAATQRQLKHLFIYPICYFLIWLIPFVNNVIDYSNYYAQNPIFGLAFVSTACLSSMGTVDCIIFSLRERPWKSIPGSDGTFWGSFYLWNYSERRTSMSPQTPAVPSRRRLSDVERPVSTPTESAIPQETSAISHGETQTGMEISGNVIEQESVQMVQSHAYLELEHQSREVQNTLNPGSTSRWTVQRTIVSLSNKPEQT